MAIPQKPNNSRFTDAQWQAIYQTGKNILVSASAGSGKTTVLVKRVIEKIQAGTPVNRLLIVTFTEAAASEMKARIEAALKESLALAKDEERSYLLEQLSLLPLANISTLHAFCLTVIQRYAYLIGLDPKFRMLTDETERLLLEEEVFAEVREAHYGTPLFDQLTNNFSSDRNDDGLQELVLNLAHFSTSHPQPFSWLASLPANYEKERVASLLQAELLPLFVETMTNSLHAYQEWLQLTDTPVLQKNYQTLLLEAQGIENILTIAKSGDLDRLYAAVASFTFGKMTAVSKAEPELKETSKEITAARKEIRKQMESTWQMLFPEAPQVMWDLLPKAQSLVTELTAITQEFMASFAAKKRQLGVLDFGDLEHFAYDILHTPDAATQELIAQQFYQERFAEVMVDEYQDINQLQDALLKTVACGDNLFMVGDVKQSIYGFRLAEPSLFLDKYQHYQGPNADGLRILLQENFRSRKEVIDFTNLIFSQLMNEKVGQLDYDGDALLIQGNKSFTPSANCTPEILIYEKKSAANLTADDNNPHFEDKTDGELALVAKKIQELIATEFPILDKETKEVRPIRYQDIVLLTPTRKNNLALLETFKQFQLPVVVGDAENYFQTTEIQTVLALLKIIDNPYQDIPLVAVLRSAMVGFTEEQLALIRAANLEVSFYEALLQFVENPTTPFVQQVQEFLAQLQKFREYRKTHDIQSLLWQIYDETAYLDYVSGLPEGPQRHANLTALTQRAAAYEEMSYRGLFQFIRFIEKMQEKRKDLAEPTVLGAEDAVRVMTIHGSKGLEFPVVFLLDMNKSFNLQDLSAKSIYDKNLGIGISYLDEERLRHTTYPYVILKEYKRRLLLSEEMRKLYVALTRAEEKLFLVGSYDDQEALIKSWQRGGQTQDLFLPATLRLANTSFMDWVGFTLSRHPAFKALGTTETPLSQLQQFGNVRLQFYQAQDLVPAPSVPTAEETTAKEGPQTSHITPEALAILQAHYPHILATKTASYQSVSEIKQVFSDPDEKVLLPYDRNNPAGQGQRYVEDDFSMPAFIQGAQEVTAAEIGTATHLLLQLIPLTTAPTLADFQALAADLVAKGILNMEVAQKIQLSTLVAFFATPLGQELLAHGEKVKREQPFSMLLPADELFATADSQDEILIHGIIDAYFETPAGIVLLDFKTDQLGRFSKAAAQEHLKERYTGQLNLYAKALSAATGQVVIRKELVALADLTTVTF